MRGTALLLALLVPALAVPAAASAGARAVGVRNDFFAPRTVTVIAGDTVRWTWQGGRRPHNVASPAFGDSGVRRRGTFAVRFRRAGSYAYFCYLHDGMTGTVVVRRRA
jgi:plastocyanin